MLQFHKTEKKDNILRCNLLYPKDCSELFEDVIAPFLKERFALEYHQICYEGISRESIQLIRNSLQDSCIVLFAYVGDITLEYSYKLGLAHAYDSHVILVNFQNEHACDIPRCIKFDFLIPVINISNIEDLYLFLDKISDIIVSYISEDLIEFLYKQAISLCEELEKNTCRTISRVDKVTFFQRLSEDEIAMCISNYDKSSIILLRKIVEDSKMLAIALNALNLSKKVVRSPAITTDSAIVNVRIANNMEATAVAEQSPRQQIFQAPVGVVANDHAQVPNFTQNNNANTAELLQLITSLRQTAATFPKEIQEELTIDLDDVELELKKPEADRNPTKLKKRLLALATAGTLIATPIAGITNFANTAIDLATKVGIELPLK